MITAAGHELRRPAIVELVVGAGGLIEAVDPRALGWERTGKKLHWDAAVSSAREKLQFLRLLAREVEPKDIARAKQREDVELLRHAAKELQVVLPCLERIFAASHEEAVAA